MKQSRTTMAVDSRAKPGFVYAAAKDSSRYPIWSRIGSFEHLKDGAGERFGVGSQRRFRTWPLNLVEEVVELIPDRRVGYVLRSGLPFRDYRANIDIEPTETGSRITWSNSFYVEPPIMRAFFEALMLSVYREMTPQLAREAERLESESR